VVAAAQKLLSPQWRLYSEMAAVKSILAIATLAPLLSAQNGSSSLSGRVVNSVTRAGIADAQVRVCRNGSAPPGMIVCALDQTPTAVTDETGAFRLTGLVDGPYILLPVPKEGFFPTTRAGSQITITGDTRLDLEMTPLAGVRGKVLDPEGKPAAGVVVALDSRCNGCTAIDVSITNEDGEYEFTGLPPNDSLILSASPKTQDPKAEEKIVTTYYPSLVDRDLAQGVRSEGIDLFGYDIKLRTAPAHSVRGVVVDDDGKPVPKAIVSIVKPASGMVAAFRGDFPSPPAEVPVAEPSETRDDGTFTFPSVLRGNWTLRAVGGLPTHAGSAEVSVSDSEVEDVQVRIAPAFDIELQTDWGDSPPSQRPVKIPANLGSFVPLDSPRPLPPPGDLQPGQVPRFNGFAGNYLVALGNAPAGYYLAAVLLDNRDVLGQVTEISAGDSLKLIFKTDGGTVRGTVENGADTMVWLMADPTASGRLGYGAQCDGGGAFLIRDVPPGEYTAVAMRRPLPGPTSPEFLGLLAANGKRVRVEAGSSAQLDLRVARQ
jgi:hypothetical protein